MGLIFSTVNNKHLMVSSAYFELRDLAPFLRGDKSLFSILPVEVIDISTPRNFLMRDERKFLSLVALKNR